MSSLREWLEQQQPDERIVSCKGRKFKVVESNMAERSRVLAAHAKNGHLDNADAEALLMCLSVHDPDSGERVVEPSDFQVWKNAGLGFAPLLRSVLDVNGMSGDDVEDEVKNSGATAS